MLLGNNLNDNKWHRVKIIRTNSLSEVRVDEQTKTLISPVGYGIASFNSLAYIGGYEPTRSLITHYKSTAVNYKRAVYKVNKIFLTVYSLTDGPSKRYLPKIHFVYFFSS